MNKIRKILIVEDNAAQAESLMLLLRSIGQVCYIAHNVEAAKSVAVVHTPDAVILDWIIPDGGKGGLDLLLWLRGREATAQVPVVVTTGLDADDLDIPDRTGVTVLEKPCDVQSLFDAIGIKPLGALNT